MRFDAITVPAVSAEQRGSSDGCALLNFPYERPESGCHFASFWVDISPNPTLVASKEKREDARCLVILSRIAHGNVSVHVDRGRTVDAVGAAAEINIPKSAHSIRIVHILRLH